MALGIVLPPTPLGASTLAGVATLVAGVASGNVALPNAGGNADVVTVCNDGAVTAFIAFGADNTIVAAATGNAINSIPVPAGARFCMFTRSAWLAAITGASTASLRILVGNGAFFG